MKRIHLCGTIVLFVCLFHKGYSQGESPVSFLLIHPSIEANGRGNTTIAVLSDNPIASLANPGQLGVFGLSNLFAVTSYAPRTQWFPSFGVSDLTYKVWALQGGYNVGKELSLPFSVSVGAGYSRIDLDLGTYTRVDSYGRPIGRFSAFENSDNISIAVGAEYFVKVGLGWSFKSIHSLLDLSSTSNIANEAKPSATDFGLIIHAPLFDILKQAGTENVEILSGIEPLFNLTLGYAKSNMGDGVNYTRNPQTDPLPRNVSVGLTTEIGIAAKAESEQWKVFSFTLAREAADLLVERKSSGSFTYQSGLGDISLFDNIILGKIRSRENVMKGWQLTFGETAYIRGGSFAEGVNFGNRNYSTSGFGFRIRGLFKAIQAISPESMENSIFAFLAKHLDVGYDHASYHAGSGEPLDGTTFNSLILVIK